MPAAPGNQLRYSAIAEYFPLIHIKKRRVSLYKNATEILVMPAAFLHADGIATPGELCASPAAGQ
jgi:hypothetical protein